VAAVLWSGVPDGGMEEASEEIGQKAGGGEAMSGRLSEIKAKCEQYLGYQGESVGMSEVHAVLSFIHGRTIEAIAEVERLQDLVDGNESYRQECIESMDRKQTEVDRLEGVASERRQRIRDGWNVDFDRETGHELWVLDDPPLVGEKQ